ncbi:putative uncharacterized protein [Ruminococcus sp. CAG:579]|jgi:hypothetical protein|uniref:hypothetical protein n=1 Tax=Ruminococcus sp. 210702-SL.1.03 TaxID=2883233 RepID=UPI000339E5EE|nr:hypothetical protein [Ruminococcus sp. 210702-SL.1.03]MCB6614823.1 hypothetical protein [Ruminococcus sp. 210702-SL.1.03]CDA72299.1 putative uncharacterized protein [Ruminococcus sp. CAG:579]
MAQKKRKGGFRIDIILIFSVMVLLITFFAYMLNTSLEDVLTKQRGEGVVITHTESEN